MVKILPEELKTFSQYILQITGIHLDESKGYLVESRIGPLLEEYKCQSYSEFYFKSKTDVSKMIQKKVVDAITTGETSFFRDNSPFDLLQNKIIPDLIDKKNSLYGKNMQIPIRIWSAASSTGQEIYSIGIVLKEILGDLNRYSIKILGTDISDKAIAKASRGYYSKIEIERGLPQAQLSKYFTKTGDEWKISDEIRSLATFRNLNLMTDFSSLGKFDIIFCRNVAIYFTEKDKIDLFKRMEKNLESYGYLIIGSTETLAKICPQYESKRYLRSVFYQFVQPTATGAMQMATV